MKKFALTVSTALLVSGLAACNNADDNAFNDRNDNNTRPIGYYTNDDDDNRRWGWFGNNDTDGVNRRQSPFMNANDQDDNMNEGPLTDMMDRDDENNFRNNPQNYNRRGEMQDRNNHRNNVGYYDGADGQLARRIADRVEKLDQVEDARAIVYGNQVIVGADTNDSNAQDVDRKVRQAIRNIAQTRNVTVVTDDDMFDRIRTVDDDLQGGQAIEEVQSDINAILNDLGDAIQRPFENNR